MYENLIKEIAELEELSREDLIAYEENEALLLKTVNQKMSAKDNIQELINTDSLEIMYHNHQNHFKFMNNIFLMNGFELFLKTIPWVYNTYYQHGFDYDYFKVELKTWQEAIEKHLTAQSAKAINKIYQWLLDHHQDFIEISQKEESENYNISPEWEATFELFLNYLLKGKDRACIKLTKDKVKSLSDLEKFFIQVIQPAMYEVGSLWQTGKISVATEHLASSIAARIISLLYPQFISTTKYNLGQGIITAVANEYHELGSRMIADLLEFEGWDINYLGVNTPAQDLLEMLYQHQPFFVGLSVALPYNLKEAMDIIQKIKGSPELSAIKILVGGKVFNEHPQLWKNIGADAWAKSGREAIEITEKWWQNENH